MGHRKPRPEAAANPRGLRSGLAAGERGRCPVRVLTAPGRGALCCPCGDSPGVGGPCSIRVLRAPRRGAPSCLCGDSSGAGGPCSVRVVMGPEAGGPILSVW